MACCSMRSRRKIIFPDRHSQKFLTLGERKADTILKTLQLCSSTTLLTMSKTNTHSVIITSEAPLLPKGESFSVLPSSLSFRFKHVGGKNTIMLISIVKLLCNLISPSSSTYQFIAVTHRSKRGKFQARIYKSNNEYNLGAKPLLLTFERAFLCLCFPCRPD